MNSICIQPSIRNFINIILKDRHDWYLNKAKNEWNWMPKYNLQTAFSDYLIPGIKKHYNI